MTKPDGSEGHPELSECYQGPGNMPDNVGELLTRAQLDNARDVYKLIESRSELNPYQDRELAVKIINKLSEYHEEVIDKLINDDKTNSIPSWSVDLERLRLAAELLEKVELSDD